MIPLLASRLSFQSPIGYVEVMGSELGIEQINFRDEAPENSPEAPECVHEAIRQLKSYFEGTLMEFDFPLKPQGTDFQVSVWNLLRSIPFGETRSYMDLAHSLKNEKAIRAVGTANGKNPIAIVVPCHRVVGSDGSMTGYAGGIWRKTWLLRHEKETRFGIQPTLFS